MRRILFLAAAAAAVAAVPAQAQYLVQTCGYGDYTVAEVTLANREIVQVCTSDNPTKHIAELICLPCITH